jgi:hypothetical protein
VEWIKERIPFDPISDEARMSYTTGSGFLREGNSKPHVSRRVEFSFPLFELKTFH